MLEFLVQVRWRMKKWKHGRWKFLNFCVHEETKQNMFLGCLSVKLNSWDSKESFILCHLVYFLLPWATKSNRMCKTSTNLISCFSYWQLVFIKIVVMDVMNYTVLRLVTFTHLNTFLFIKLATWFWWTLEYLFVIDMPILWAGMSDYSDCCYSREGPHIPVRVRVRLLNLSKPVGEVNWHFPLFSIN